MTGSYTSCQTIATVSCSLEYWIGSVLGSFCANDRASRQSWLQPAQRIAFATARAESSIKFNPSFLQRINALHGNICFISATGESYVELPSVYRRDRTYCWLRSQLQRQPAMQVEVRTRHTFVGLKTRSIAIELHSIDSAGYDFSVIMSTTFPQ